LEEYTGIILKKISYKESSEIIYLYTLDGLIGVLVHGSKKMKSPFLNLTKVLNYVKVFVSGKNLKVLRDAEIIENNTSIVTDLEKYTYVTHMVELIYYFATHEHDHDKLLGFILKIIPEIKARADYIPYIYMLELKLLYLLGVNPNLKTCLSCDETKELVFSVKDGSCFCKNHLPDDYFSNEVLEAVKQLYYFDLEKTREIEINSRVLPEIRKLLDEYYDYHLNYHSKARKMLKGLIGY